jgi:malonyl-CoA/methylmalonyl-CoA synthetase
MAEVRSFDLISSLYQRWHELYDDLSQTTALTWLGVSDITWSYEELQHEIELSASYINTLGLNVGDVLGLQAPRSIDWLPLFLGALSRGVTVLLLNDHYTAHELKYYLSDAHAKMAIIPKSKYNDLSKICSQSMHLVTADTMQSHRRKHGCLKNLEELNGDHLAVLAYTSGTTGRPKGARIRHKDIMGTLQALHHAWEWSKDDRLVHTLPLFHIHGLFVAGLGSFWAGAQILLLPHFDALTAMKAVERFKATVLMAVPTHHHRYLQLSSEDRPKVNSLRLVTSGSAPLSADKFNAFRSAFGIEIVERYGMTEVGIVLSAKLRGLKLPGSVGYPLPNVSAKIFNAQDQEVKQGETGELHISSSSLFDGYHQRPEATKNSVYLDLKGQRWMRTGDLCFQDKEGMYWLKGRTSELIISGGLNVYPKEVELVIVEVAKTWIDEVVVVGLADPEWGERVEAFLTTPNQTQPSPHQLQLLSQELTQHLASYKRPKKITWLKVLPRNAMGKLQRFKLKST